MVYLYQVQHSLRLHSQLIVSCSLDSSRTTTLQYEPLARQRMPFTSICSMLNAIHRIPCNPHKEKEVKTSTALYYSKPHPNAAGGNPQPSGEKASAKISPKIFPAPRTTDQPGDCTAGQPFRFAPAANLVLVLLSTAPERSGDRIVLQWTISGYVFTRSKISALPPCHQFEGS